MSMFQNTAVIYARFSSEMQREESIDAQVHACRAYAQSHGLQVLRVYEDKATSAKNDRRPQFQRMIADSASGSFQVVLIHKYNRFARRMEDHVVYENRLNKNGVDLIAVAENFGTGKESIIMKSLMRALSEYYIADLSEETKKGHKENALQGLHNGGTPPFGYDVVDRHYVVNPVEAHYVQRIFQCAVERKGFQEVLREMEQQGIRGKRGKVIRYTQVYEMLRNEKYTGVYLYSTSEEKDRAQRRQKPNAIRKEDAIPPIIEKEMFQEVQKIMEKRKQTGKKAGYLCSGLVYCSCGAKMHGITTQRKGHTYRYYQCSKRCGAHLAHMEEIDAAAIQYLRNLLSPQVITTISQAMKQYAAQQYSHAQEYQKGMQQQIREKEKQIDALLHNLSSGVLPGEVVTTMGQKIQALQEEIKHIKESPIPEDYTVEQIKKWLESIQAAPDEKAVHLMISSIKITKTSIKIESTLTEVLGEIGCGRAQHSFPNILFHLQFPLT